MLQIRNMALLAQQLTEYHSVIALLQIKRSLDLLPFCNISRMQHAQFSSTAANSIRIPLILLF